MSETLRSALVRWFSQLTFFGIVTSRETFIRPVAGNPFAKCRTTCAHKSTRFRNVALSSHQGDTAGVTSSRVSQSQEEPGSFATIKHVDVAKTSGVRSHRMTPSQAVNRFASQQRLSNHEIEIRALVSWSPCSSAKLCGCGCSVPRQTYQGKIARRPHKLS